MTLGLFQTFCFNWLFWTVNLLFFAVQETSAHYCQVEVDIQVPHVASIGIYIYIYIYTERFWGLLFTTGQFWFPMWSPVTPWVLASLLLGSGQSLDSPLGFLW